jgi:hypothetical protein
MRPVDQTEISTQGFVWMDAQYDGWRHCEVADLPCDTAPLYLMKQLIEFGNSARRAS